MKPGKSERATEKSVALAEPCWNKDCLGFGVVWAPKHGPEKVCAGPLMGATVLVAVLGPARSDCAQKKKGAGETRHVLGS